MDGETFKRIGEGAIRIIFLGVVANWVIKAGSFFNSPNYYF